MLPKIYIKKLPIFCVFIILNIFSIVLAQAFQPCNPETTNCSLDVKW